MTVLSVVTTKRMFGEDNLSITLRNVGGEPAPIQSMLVVKTVSLWLYLRKLIDAGERTSPLDKTPEMAVSAGNNITFEPWQETRCTVFDWSNRYGLTVHSDTMAQAALDTYWGMHDALSELAPQNAAKSAPEATQTRETSAPATNTPKTQENGVINATRCPNPNTPMYANGQQVAFVINKIVLGTHPTSGAITYSLWSPLGQKYAIKTIYRTRANSDEDSQDYAIVAPTLEALNLGIPGNVQSVGNWRLIVSAAHVEQKDKTVKEFLNVLSLQSMI